MLKFTLRKHDAKCKLPKRNLHIKSEQYLYSQQFCEKISDVLTSI